MAIFKCKMCGGTLEITEGTSVCTCDYCGTEQTLPRLDSDKKENLYDRANHFRRNNDFDKAMSIYEQILNEDSSDAEAYWSLVICKYGIEYVEDPTSHKRIPTVNRAQFTSIYDDENYKQAIANADSLQKAVYEQEAHAINEIQKGILAISNKEEPFDVFICYKETDDAGRRTPDSVLANDLYHQLTQEGFKVFFSRITLEDKLGQEYEPYIFAALNSSKVMVVIGTKPEYYKAVWVRNEWSRYLALIRQGEKKMLIPAYKDMDPYDLPEEFSHLQAQDMTKLGFMQDLIRGIKKIIGANEPQTGSKETVVVQQGGGTGNTNALIKRGNMALEDGEWEKADGFFEEVLNQDAECAEAYLGKFLSKCKRSNVPSLTQYYISKYESSETEELDACEEAASRIENAVSQYMVLDYLSDSEIRKRYAFDRTYVSELSFRKQQKSQALTELASEKLLSRAKQYASGETTSLIDKMLEDITVAFDRHITDAEKNDNEQIASVKNSYEMHLNEADAKVKELYNNALERQDSTYNSRVAQMNTAKSISDYEEIRDLFKGMHGYKDTLELAEKCQSEVDRLREEERLEAEKLEADRRKEAARKAKKMKTITAIVAIVTVAVIVSYLVVTKIIIPNNNYNKAVRLMNDGNYEKAIAEFEILGGYKDSVDQIKNCETAINYDKAVRLMNDGNYEKAIAEFEILGGYKDSVDQIKNCETAIKNENYDKAVRLMNDGNYEKAIAEFEILGGYKDSVDQIKNCETAIKNEKYDKAVRLMNSGNYRESYELFELLNDYKDSEELKKSICFEYELELISEAKIGDTVLFGNYNGNTEWIILAKEEDKILVISKYALEKRPYNTEEKAITWEKCTLRSWLNETYLASAFSSDEQSKIIGSTINSNNGRYGNGGGNNTTDKVFLLSLDEVIKYFTVSKSVTTLTNGEACRWWVRSPGYYENYAAYVGFDGIVDAFGNHVNDENEAVRPALWIQVE